MIYKNYLTFPGNGVHTVHTARDKKEKLIRKYYETSDFNQAQEKWKKSLSLEKNTYLLGCPSDCGAGIVRGSNWGPLFLRSKLIEEEAITKFIDCGDIRVVPHLLHDKYLNPETIKSVQKALGLNSSQPVSPLSMLEDFSRDFFKNHSKKHLLTFGGDHSISYPLSISWIRQFKKDDIGILHFDAHTDLLSERLGIDYCFGSWAYHALKELPNSQSLVQVGIRSSGKTKSYWEEKFKFKQVWSDEVRSLGALEIAKQIVEHYQNQGVKKLYLSFDIDAIDMNYAGATGTPEPEGLLPTDALVILNEVSQYIEIHSADLVEVAPYISYPESANSIEPDATIESAFSIIQFLLEYWNK